MGEGNGSISWGGLPGLLPRCPSGSALASWSADPCTRAPRASSRDASPPSGFLGATSCPRGAPFLVAFSSMPGAGHGVRVGTEEANAFSGKFGGGSFHPLWVILSEEGTDTPGPALWVLHVDDLLLEAHGRVLG